MPWLSLPFAVVVDDDVVRDVDLVGMAQHDTGAEGDASSAGSQQQGVQLRAQEQPECAGHVRTRKRDELVFQEREPAGATDHEFGVALRLRLALVEQLTLDDGDALVVLAGRLLHRRPPSTRGALATRSERTRIAATGIIS
jgi:hypothetical protein